MEDIERGHPLVSVVIATYNRWPMVRDAIESALAQSFPAFEVIVVDDGSTDGTADRIEQHYPAVRLVRQQNAERGAAYNRGVALARGDYVAFLDDDDVYEPWHLSQFAAALERHPNAQLFASRSWLWDPALARRRLVPPFDPLTLRRDALVETTFVPQVLIAAKSAFVEVGGFPEECALIGSEDWLLLIKLTRRFDVVPLPEASVRIRVHAGRSVNDLAWVSRSRDAVTQLLLDGDVPSIHLDDRERRLVKAGTDRFVAGHLYAAGAMPEARARLRSVRRALGWSTGQRWTLRLWLQTWLGRRGSAAARRVKERVLWR